MKVDGPNEETRQQEKEREEKKKSHVNLFFNFSTVAKNALDTTNAPVFIGNV